VRLTFPEMGIPESEVVLHPAARGCTGRGLETRLVVAVPHVEFTLSHVTASHLGVDDNSHNQNTTFHSHFHASPPNVPPAPCYRQCGMSTNAQIRANRINARASTGSAKRRPGPPVFLYYETNPITRRRAGCARG
jgi:hypothetical protein